MTSTEAWTQVGSDIWYYARFVVTPICWVALGAFLAKKEEPFSGDEIVFAWLAVISLIAAIVCTVWSYQ